LKHAYFLLPIEKDEYSQNKFYKTSSVLISNPYKASMREENPGSLIGKNFEPNINELK
jgi:hypothetical protein